MTDVGSSLVLDVRIARLTGRSYVAIVQMGGMTIRGARSSEPLGAVQSLFFKLSQSGTHQNGEDEAAIAIELALENETIEDIVSRPAQDFSLPSLEEATTEGTTEATK